MDCEHPTEHHYIQYFKKKRKEYGSTATMPIGGRAPKVSDQLRRALIRDGNQFHDTKSQLNPF